MNYRLSEEHVAMAEKYGQARQDHAQRINASMKFKEPGVSRQHINTVRAELIVAGVTGRGWRRDNNLRLKAAKVGEDIAVRWQQEARPGYLIVRDWDADEFKYVYVTGWPDMTVHGYMTGEEAKNEYPVDPRDRAGVGHWIPIDELHPIEELAA